MAAPERVRTRDQIITSIYGTNSVMSGRTVDSHIRNLRHKTQALGYSDIIRTIHGVGLRLGSCTT
ncbi:helix-turn-helix domain-containing protein [Pseudophaeobacter leonis]|uniref:helix-turn-helix domain-containing protein n=1 Tax=Pseudophaeobacter leonis TaxID=1144477 RepID=UPI003B98101A